MVSEFSPSLQIFEFAHVCVICGYSGHWMSQQIVLKSGVSS